MSNKNRLRMTIDVEQSWAIKMMAPLEPAIVCVNIDAMRDFYTRVLGFTEVSDAEATPEMSEMFGAAPNGYRIIRVETAFGDRVKLIQPNNRKAKKSRSPSWVLQRRGFAYITFIVEEIDAVTARLIANGVKLVRPRPVEPRKGFLAIFAEDLEGNFLEFVEYADILSYRPDLYKQRPDRDGDAVFRRRK